MNTECSSVQERLFGLVDQVRGSGTPVAGPASAYVRLSDLGVSSLAMVNLMLALELEFDITIPPHEITPENFHSVSSIASMLDRLLPDPGR